MKSTSNLNAIFITGISASGKTTLAKELVNELRNTYFSVLLLDGTEMYEDSILYPFNGHTLNHRKERASHHIRLVKWISTQKILPIIAFIGQPLSIRDMWGSHLDDWKEIYLKCDVKTCIARDNKDLYNSKKKNTSIIGVDNEFDEPKDPWLEIDTSKHEKGEVLNIAYNKIKLIEWLGIYKINNKAQ